MTTTTRHIYNMAPDFWDQMSGAAKLVVAIFFMFGGILGFGLGGLVLEGYMISWGLGWWDILLFPVLLFAAIATGIGGNIYGENNVHNW